MKFLKENKILKETEELDTRVKQLKQKIFRLDDYAYRHGYDTVIVFDNIKDTVENHMNKYKDELAKIYDSKEFFEESKNFDLDEALGLKEGISGKMTVEEIAKKHKVPVSKIKAQLEKGIKVEKEHTKDEKKAERIALDHLFEIPNYYDKLAKMEKSALKESVSIKKPYDTLTWKEKELADYLFDEYKEYYGRHNDFLRVDLPDFNDLKEEIHEYYSEDISNAEIRHVIKALTSGIEEVEIYEGEIQLDDSPVMNYIHPNIPENSFDEFDGIYWIEVDNWLERFEKENNIKVGYAGRSGRHIITPMNVETYINFDYLKDKYDELQSDFIDYMNNINLEESLKEDTEMDLLKKRANLLRKKDKAVNDYYKHNEAPYKTKRFDKIQKADNELDSVENELRKTAKYTDKDFDLLNNWNNFLPIEESLKEDSNKQKTKIVKESKRLKEELGAYSGEPFCDEIANRLEDGFWSDETENGTSWELEINGMPRSEFMPSFADYLAEEVSYPVRDGHLSYMDIEMVLSKSTLESIFGYDDLERFVPDLIKLGVDREAINEWLKDTNPDAELDFWYDYDINFDVDEWEVKNNLSDEVELSIYDIDYVEGETEPEELEEMISDYLSDTYGYTHKGFNFDVDGDTIYVYGIEWDLSESLKESKLNEWGNQIDEYKISDTELLTMGAEKGSYGAVVYYVNKIYKPSENEDIWNTEFHRTYPNEKLARKAFNSYKRKYSTQANESLLKESSHHLDDFYISDSESLNLDWNKGDIYTVSKNYKIDDQGIWGTEFVRTYGNEEDARRAFNIYKRKFSKITENLKEKLIQGKSEEIVRKNTETEIKAGKYPKQAYAIAKSIQRKNMKEDLEETAKLDDEFTERKEIIKDGKSTWVKTEEDEKVWNSLSDDDRHFLSMSNDMDFWFDEIQDNEELEDKYYELSSKFSKSKSIKESLDDDADYFNSEDTNESKKEIEYDDEIEIYGLDEQLEKETDPKKKEEIQTKIDSVDKEIDYADDHNNPAKVIELQQEISKLNEETEEEKIQKELEKGDDESVFTEDELKLTDDDLDILNHMGNI